MTQNQLRYWENQETIRANLAREKETYRSNLAKEVETNRHNLAIEGLTSQQNAIAWANANELQRSNKAKEVENLRHALQTEQLSLLQISESQRHNQVSEGIILQNNIASQNESNRHNLATEQFNIDNLAYQTERDTLDREIEQQRADAQKLQAEASMSTSVAQWSKEGRNWLTFILGK